MFSGAVLLVLGVGVSAWCRGRWTKSFRSLLVWLGLVLMITSVMAWPVAIRHVWSGALGWFLAEEAPWVRYATGAFAPRSSLSPWRA